jgi:hypothetical protein
MKPPQRAHRICPLATRGASLFRSASLGAAIAACRRGSTEAGALEFLDLAARTRSSSEDDLALPADTGERAHFDAASQPRLGRRRAGARVAVRVVSAVKKLGHGHSLMILASTGLLWRRIWPGL